MQKPTIVTALAMLITFSGAANAEDHIAAEAARPKLVVAISVDQLSADLFSEYRSRFPGGLKRLASGAVFPSGYQSHAATETCPGHSTIMTGVHSGRALLILSPMLLFSAAIGAEMPRPSNVTKPSLFHQ